MSLRSHDAGGFASAGPAPTTTRFSLRVGIVHGNRMFADLLREHSERVWGCDVVATECAGTDGLMAIERTQPDIVIVGHAPPMVDACTLVPKLKRIAGPTKVIVVARRATEYLVHRLASQEFHGIVDESSEGIATVQTAIERVREGSRLLSPRFAFLSARLRSNPNAFPKLLSGRQEEVLVCIAHAMEDDEIGRCLGMSTRTALRHRADIMRKLNVHGTPRLIRYCIEAGFDDTCVPPASERKGKS